MSDILLILFLYFSPTILAMVNGNADWSDVGHVMIINLFIGWTVIGFFIAAWLASLDFRQIRRNNAAKERVRQAQANFYLREDAKANR